MTHRELSDVLIRLRLATNASDLHGSLIGYLCGGGKAGPGNWLAALEMDADTMAAGEDSDLVRLHQECRDQLDDSELGFAPLLPDDEEAITLRAEAMTDWCRGFLGGLGLAGVGAPQSSVSDESREILADFSAIAASDFSCSGNEEDEEALSEIIEFVRVSVLLLYSELGCPPPIKHSSGASRRMH